MGKNKGKKLEQTECSKTESMYRKAENIAKEREKELETDKNGQK